MCPSADRAGQGTERIPNKPDSPGKRRGKHEEEITRKSKKYQELPRNCIIISPEIQQVSQHNTFRIIDCAKKTKTNAPARNAPQRNPGFC